ncbi:MULTISPECIES: virulence factor family protein [unclassified Gilliamella]|uniref:virulence factor family protein n=1 Tax=unclassified Gilliamella TaxID=2685620 RepID=UPI00226A6CAC|nr:MULTISPECIES: AcvB/VirJ family lysyl-phosphatidylglycerol hydrolase [unclassified Gilliamella]MCX8601283.1 virulence factor family protein [Gilliamella sp. B3722]MCX8607437.1 virulence factor family protein [Gilliamella sp. B3771]MCX8610374.1 virulence factor family protein [Gilliamella sp. B3891]MCX8612957.1 virulence factor family protein [Gilliamella sp. B3773]MCX8614866.1 virulence factor family protein [Gilliamella sp. B3770]
MKKTLRYILLFLMLVLITLLVFAGLYYYKKRQSASVNTITIDSNFSVLSATPKTSAEAAAIIVATEENHFSAQQLLDLSKSTGAKLVQFELKPNASCLEQQNRFDQAKKILNESHYVVAGMQEGAAFAYRWLTKQPNDNAKALSIEFTLDHKDCDAPLPSQASHGIWQVIWNNPPDEAVAVFPREQKKINVTTSIGEYQASPVELLSLHLSSILYGEHEQLPVIELPAKDKQAHPETVTFYYSGDGGWRDLDKVSAEYMASNGYSVVGVDALKLFWQHRSVERSSKDLAHLMQQYRDKWGTKRFVLAGYSFGGDILPALYNRLSPQDQQAVQALVLIAFSKDANFEIEISGWLGQSGQEMKTAPEVDKIPANKLFCIYGEEEQDETGCLQPQMKGEAVKLPGGHHFDNNYPHLGQIIMDAIDKRITP